MKWLRNFVRGFPDGIAPPSIKRLDLTEVSKSIAEQVVNEPESVVVNDIRVSDPRIVQAVRESRRREMEMTRYADPLYPTRRDFAAEHKDHVDRYYPDGTLKAESKPFGTVKVKWHAGIAVKSPGDPKRDIHDARHRLYGRFSDEPSDYELTDRVQQAEAQMSLQEENRRKADEERKREALRAAEAAAEAAELEAIGQLAAAEVDLRYSRF